MHGFIILKDQNIINVFCLRFLPDDGGREASFRRPRGCWMTKRRRRRTRRRPNVRRKCSARSRAEKLIVRNFFEDSVKANNYLLLKQM